MEETKKEYGGCLSILLPLWIIGQVLSMIINFTLFGFYTDNPIIPILLIGINVVALIGIILLLQFKKSGFFIFISAYLFSVIWGFACPDIIDKSTTIKTIIGMCLFLILMGIKNKNTKKNGYQTLELFSNQEKDRYFEVPIESEDYKEEETTNDVSTLSEVESLNDSDVKIIPQNVEVPKEQTDQFVSSIIGLEQDSIENQEMSKQQVADVKKNSNKYIYISAVVSLFVIVAGVVFFTMHDWRSDEEIFKDGKKNIEEQKYEKGLEELEKIQDHYIPAKALLGDLYTLNDSVKRDMERGLKLLWEAYEANDTNACSSLSDIYIEKGDWEKSEEIFKKGIDMGLWKGYRGLAYLYYADEFGGTPNPHKNYKKAEYYALKIANKDSWCCAMLGDVYYNGGDGVTEDNSKAFYWWDKGGKLGGYKSYQCFTNLGWLYHNGYGVKQNYKKAYESYKKAISLEKEDCISYYQLSIMFRNGQYVKANRDSLKFYLERAAEYGDENAAVELENEF